MGQFFILRSRVQQEYNSLLVNALNRIFKSNQSLNNFKWLLTKLELSRVRYIIPRSRKRLWNGYPVLTQELQNHDPVGRYVPVWEYPPREGEPPSHPHVSKRSASSESSSWELWVNKLQWIYNFTIYRKNKYRTSAFTLLKLILPDIVTVSQTSSIKPKMYAKIFSFSVEWYNPVNPDELRCNLTSYDWVAPAVVKRRVWGFDDRKHGFSLNKGSKGYHGMQNLWITTIVMQQRPRRQRQKSKLFGFCFHGGGGPLPGMQTWSN